VVTNRALLSRDESNVLRERLAATAEAFLLGPPSLDVQSLLTGSLRRQYLAEGKGPTHPIRIALLAQQLLSMANEPTWLQAHTAECSSWSTVGEALTLIMNVAHSDVVLPDATDPVTAAIETRTLGKLACLPSEAILKAKGIVHLAGRACDRAPSAIGHAADFKAQPFQDEAERQKAERQDFKHYLNGLHDGLDDHAMLGLWVSATRVLRSLISIDSASLGFYFQKKSPSRTLQARRNRLEDLCGRSIAGFGSRMAMVAARGSRIQAGQALKRSPASRPRIDPY
jgi:hypothetical protein